MDICLHEFLPIGIFSWGFVPVVLFSRAFVLICLHAHGICPYEILFI